jgi:hypothetical protein
MFIHFHGVVLSTVYQDFHGKFLPRFSLLIYDAGGGTVVFNPEKGELSF